MKIFSRLVIVFVLLFSFSMSTNADFFDLFTKPNQVPYCNDLNGSDCGLDEGIDQIRIIEDIETERSFSEYIQDVIRYLLTFLALAFVILIIYSGFNMLLAAGDEEKAKKSKTIIQYAVIGVVIIFLAYSISEFVFSILGLRELPNV